MLIRPSAPPTAVCGPDAWPESAAARWFSLKRAGGLNSPTSHLQSSRGDASGSRGEEELRDWKLTPEGQAFARTHRAPLTTEVIEDLATRNTDVWLRPSKGAEPPSEATALEPALVNLQQRVPTIGSSNR